MTSTVDENGATLSRETRDIDTTGGDTLFTSSAGSVNGTAEIVVGPTQVTTLTYGYLDETPPQSCLFFGRAIG